jgi:hypothetical protein
MSTNKVDCRNVSKLTLKENKLRKDENKAKAVCLRQNPQRLTIRISWLKLHGGDVLGWLYRRMCNRGRLFTMKTFTVWWQLINIGMNKYWYQQHVPKFYSFPFALAFLTKRSLSVPTGIGHVCSRKSKTTIINETIKIAQLNQKLSSTGYRTLRYFWNNIYSTFSTKIYDTSPRSENRWHGAVELTSTWRARMRQRRGRTRSISQYSWTGPEIKNNIFSITVHLWTNI